MKEEIILTNKTTNNVLMLSRLMTDDYVLDSVDWGSVPTSHLTHKYPNQVGSDILSSVLDSRQVTIIGWVIATTDELMSELKRSLNAFVNPLQDMELVYNGYLLNIRPSTSVRYATTERENNRVVCKFQITALAAYPLFALAEPDYSEMNETEPLFHFPLIISNQPDPPGGIVFGEKSQTLLVNIFNDSSMNIGMTIYFVANGTVVNPSLVHIQTQEFFGINKTIIAGEEIRVETEIGSRSVRGFLGNQELNYFKYMDFDSSWLQLAPGDNTLRRQADSGIDFLEVRVEYSIKFLEVEE